MLKQPSEKKPVLGIYARVSTADQADFGVSLEDQEKRGIEIASKKESCGVRYKIYHSFNFRGINT